MPKRNSDPATSNSSPRVLIVTPQLRRFGRAIVSAHQMIASTPHPVEWLSINHEQPYGPYDARNVLHSYQLATQRMLAGEYTHLLTLEDDMVVPRDAIVRLLATGAPVAYSLYCWRRDRHPWSAYKVVWPESGASWSEDQPHAAAKWLQAGAVRSVAGLGLGCTLIERSVLERVPWRLPENAPAANDWYFALDLQAAGIRQVCDFGVVCGHIRLDPSARVIWPHVNDHGRASYRYEYFEVAP